MPTHRPKTAALIAYSEDLLSETGKARLERHLSGCEVCRSELAAMEMYDSMIESVHSTNLPQIDFASMETALAREAASVSRELRARHVQDKLHERRRPYAMMVGVAALAAAGVLAYSAWTQPPSSAPVARPSAVPEATAEPDVAPATSLPLHPVVTLAAGEAVQLRAGEELPITVGDAVPEGTAIRIGDGELHVRLSEGTGIVAMAQTRLSLVHARTDGVRVQLESGSLGQQVAPRGEGERYVVATAGYEVEVRGTRFVVSREGPRVGVDLSEGTVTVRTPDGRELILVAPARWRSDGSRETGDPTPVEVRQLAAPTEPVTEVRVRHPELVRWRLDDTAVSANGSIALLAERGEHQVSGWDAQGHLFRATLQVGDAPVAIEPEALVPEAPRLRPGHLDPEQMREMLERGRRQIGQCYESALRNGSSVLGHSRLRVHLAVDGTVERAQVIGMSGDGAEALSTCIQNYASRWTFPPPGGPMTFDQPLNFAPIQ
ncbi:MAG: AgmX/PglI C-terminal domain-containing protein [Sandaracinaceae bacterium]